MADQVSQPDEPTFDPEGLATALDLLRARQGSLEEHVWNCLKAAQPGYAPKLGRAAVRSAIGVLMATLESKDDLRRSPLSTSLPQSAVDEWLSPEYIPEFLISTAIGREAIGSFLLADRIVPRPITFWVYRLAGRLAELTMQTAIERYRATTQGATAKLGPVSVVTGSFAPLLQAGLRVALATEPRIRVRAENVAVEHIRSYADGGVDALIVSETTAQALSGDVVSPTTLVIALGSRELISDSAHCLKLPFDASAPEITTTILRAAASARKVLVGRPLLTPKEQEVFSLLREGRVYAEIGLKLHIAPETARGHTRSICKKLNVASKRDLIGFAMRTPGVVA